MAAWQMLTDRTVSSVPLVTKPRVTWAGTGMKGLPGMETQDETCTLIELVIKKYVSVISHPS